MYRSKRDLIQRHIVDTPSDESAFGEKLVTSITPQVQLLFPYEVINTRLAIASSSGAGSVTASSSKIILQTGTSANSTARLKSKEFVKYKPGEGGISRFTAAFPTDNAGSVQRVGLGDDNDGYFIVCSDGVIGIVRRVSGTDNYTMASDFNGDPLDGTGPTGISLDFTKGNVFQIKYQWLGYGMVYFFAEDPTSGEFINFHSIRYASTSTETTVLNPSLPLFIEAENTSSTDNTSVIVASMMGGTEGKMKYSPNPSEVRYGYSASTGGITTERAIFTLYNATSFNGLENKIDARPDFLTIAFDGTKIGRSRVILNATLTTGANVSIDSVNSPVSIDTLATAVTGGIEIISFELGKTDSDVISLSDLNIYVRPGESLTLTGESASSTEAGASLSWLEII